MKRNIDWKAFEKELNQQKSISKTCLKFGISDNGLHQCLSRRDLFLKKTYVLKRIKPKLDDGRDKKEIDYDLLLEKLNEVGNKSKVASEFGMELINLGYFLKNRNLKLIEKYEIRKLSDNKPTEEEPKADNNKEAKETEEKELVGV